MGDLLVVYHVVRLLNCRRFRSSLLSRNSGRKLALRDIPLKGVEVSTMPAVPIQIVRFLSEDQPGFVEGELLDAFGKIHRFQDKVPVIAEGDLWHDTSYPQPGMLACEVIQRWTDVDGRDLARIDTERPYDIESTDGEYWLVFVADQICDER